MYGGRSAAKRSGPVDPGQLPRYGRSADCTLPWVLRRVGASQVEGICRAKIRVDADAVLSPDSGQDAASAAATEVRRAAEAAEASGGELETLDPIADLKVQKLELVTAVRERQALLARRAAMPCHRSGR